MKFRIGLDLGIASVGWAVIEDDAKGNPRRIIDLGSRIFDAAEKPKDGSPLAKARRDKRDLRRRLRRKQHRVKRTKALLERYNIMTVKEIEDMYENYKFQFSPYELRVKALDEKLTNAELSRVLISLVKRRGYKSNSKSEENDNKEAGKLITATKENEKLMQEKGYRTLAEMYLKDEKFKVTNRPDYNKIKLEYSNQNNKLNKEIFLKIKNTTDDYKSTPLRKLVEEEIKIILNKQKGFNNKINDKFIEEYLKIFLSQRSFDEGPGAPSPYGGDQIEKMLGKCTFEADQERAAKATYTFEYFKILQDLNHIKIEKTDINEEGEINKSIRILSKEEKDNIIELAKEKPTITYNTLRKKLILETNERFNMVDYKSIKDFTEEVNKESEKNRKFKEFESYHKIRVALNHIEKGYIEKLSKDQLDIIGRTLTVYKNDNKRIEKLQEFLKKEYIDELLKLSFSKVGHLSIKAMQKIIPELEKGNTYDKAVNKIYEDFRGIIKTDKKRKLSLNDLEQGISNPVARRSVSQTIKVVNAITLKYGNPDIVNIELAREMAQNFDERKKIKKNQEKNLEKNEKSREKIIELGKAKPTGQDIVKYKLWQEQDGMCIYSGKKIPISDLFTEAVDVDHIIPYSMCFDDTYKNKVLVLASENRQKGNRVPYQYMKELGRDLEEYEVRVNNYIRSYPKKQRLLKEKFTREDAEDWKERNIQDTKYLSKLVYNLLRKNLKFAENENFKRKVYAINGSVTSHIRKRLGIEKIRANGDKHHAIDAAIIAITSQGMIQKITKFYQYKEARYVNNQGEYVDTQTGEIITKEKYEELNGIRFPEPWINFTKELEIRTECKTKERMIELLEANKIYTYEDYDDVKPIFVSRMPRRKIKGEAHKDTVRGLKVEDGIIKTITKTELKNLKLDKDGEIKGYPKKQKQDDRLLYEALQKKLRENDGKGEKAFTETFYKPKKNGTLGPVVKKVKIEEKSTLNVSFNKGKSSAANGDMVRIDVFKIPDDGYYFVPIYVADTIKKELPNKACVAAKGYQDWKTMKEEDFIFSLYPKDLIYIRGNGKVKLNPSNSDEKASIEVEDLYAYYVKAGISVAQITIITNDNEYCQSSLGIKNLKEIKKYEVDVLGNYHEVKIPEKRQKFNIKKERGEA